MFGDSNTKVGRKEKYRPTIGKYSLHEKTNNNGERLITFAISKILMLMKTMAYTNRHGYLLLANSQPDRSRISR